MAGRAPWRALLKVGHPEQASEPPVPSHLPSPGQVPTCGGLGEGEAAGVGMTCACIGFTGTGDSVGFGEGEGTEGRRVGRVLWLKVM